MFVIGSLNGVNPLLQCVHSIIKKLEVYYPRINEFGDLISTLIYNMLSKFSVDAAFLLLISPVYLYVIKG